MARITEAEKKTRSRRVMTLYNRGYMQAEIAEHVGCAQQTVSDYVRRAQKREREWDALRNYRTKLRRFGIDPSEAAR